MLAVAAMVFTFSCKKEEVVTFEKANLIGTWTQVKPVSDAGQVDKLRFTNDSVFMITVSGNSSTTIGLTYTFDGKTVKYNFLADFTMTISDLSASKFSGSTVSSFLGQSSAAEGFEYKK